MTEEQTVKIMTYNIWNYNDPWPERRRLIVDTILKEDPDIIGLQEIRDDRRYNSIGQDQARQIADRTGLEYHFQPAMVYSKNPRCVEGLCVMSRFPIKSASYIQLTRNPEDPNDFHQRIVLNGTISLDLGELEFFVTHFSLSPQMRICNAVELLSFLDTFNSPLPKFVVGDFNATPEETPVRILTGMEKTEGQEVMGNLLDVWEEAPPTRRKYPAEGKLTHGDRRIDYIFVRGTSWMHVEVKQVSIVDTYSPDGIHASDHAALTATLHLVPDN